MHTAGVRLVVMKSKLITSSIFPSFYCSVFILLLEISLLQLEVKCKQNTHVCVRARALARTFMYLYVHVDAWVNFDSL